MFKALWQSIVGRGREAVNNNVDLKYAGQEQIRKLKGDIDGLETRITEMAGRRMLLDERHSQIVKEAAKFKDATTTWKEKDELDKAKDAYAEYTRLTAQADELDRQSATLSDQIDELDSYLRELTISKEQLENNITIAAGNQSYSKGLKQTEAIHKEMNSGHISDVIEQTKRQTAEAKAARERRLKNDKSDLLPPTEKKSSAYAFDDL